MIPFLFGETTVDDVFDPGESDGSFGDVRREDDFSSVWGNGEERASLFECWKLRVEWCDGDL